MFCSFTLMYLFMKWRGLLREKEKKKENVKEVIKVTIKCDSQQQFQFLAFQELKAWRCIQLSTYDGDNQDDMPIISCVCVFLLFFIFFILCCLSDYKTMSSVSLKHIFLTSIIIIFFSLSLLFGRHFTHTHTHYLATLFFSPSIQFATHSIACHCLLVIIMFVSSRQSVGVLGVNQHSPDMQQMHSQFTVWTKLCINYELT